MAAPFSRGAGSGQRRKRGGHGAPDRQAAKSRARTAGGGSARRKAAKSGGSAGGGAMRTGRGRESVLLRKPPAGRPGICSRGRRGGRLLRCDVSSIPRRDGGGGKKLSPSGKKFSTARTRLWTKSGNERPRRGPPEGGQRGGCFAKLHKRQADALFNLLCFSAKKTTKKRKCKRCVKEAAGKSRDFYNSVPRLTPVLHRLYRNMVDKTSCRR